MPIQDLSDKELMALSQAPAPRTTSLSGGSNIQSLSDEQLLALHKQTQPQPVQPASDFSGNIPSDPTADKIPAFAKGVVRGVGDSALDFAGLAGDILEHFGLTHAAGETVNKFVKKGQEYNQPSKVELDNPWTSSIGAGIGYTGGMIASGGGGAAGIKAIPGIARAAEKVGPALSGMAREGVIGATQGAAMNPQDRSLGMAIGGVTGSALGALGGALGGAAKTQGNRISQTLNEAERIGQPRYSDESLNAARNTFETGGVNQAQENTSDRILQSIHDEMAKNGSTAFMPDQSPARLLAAKASTNYKNVVAENKANWAPLNAATETVPVHTIKLSIDNLPQNARNYLPEKTLPEDASFSQIQEFRQAMDRDFRAAKKSLNPREFREWYGIRQQASNGMQSAAENAGLKDQFVKAEDHYIHQVLPFRTLTKEGKIATPEQADVAWSKINQIISAKNPKPGDLKNVISTLGPEGKDLVGWAAIQNAVSKAAESEPISVNSLNNALNRWNISGLNKTIFTDTHKNTILGIKRLIKAGNASLKQQGHQYNIFGVGNAINSFISTNKGLKLLDILGGLSPSAPMYRQIIQSAVTGSANIIMNQPWLNDRSGKTGDPNVR